MALRNVTEETAVIARYMPTGKAWDAFRVLATNCHLLLKGLASEHINAHEAIQTFRDEILPDETSVYLDEWEMALGIPDDCFPVSDTEDLRRRNILIKLASLGVQTAAEFEALALLFGIVVEVNSGIAHDTYATKLPSISFADDKTARNTIVVVINLPASEIFTYDYPIPFSNSDREIMECLFTKLKPAVCDIRFELAP